MNIVQLSGLVLSVDKETEGKTFLILSSDDEQVEMETSHLSANIEVGDYVIASGKLKTVVDHLISSRSSVEFKSLSVDIQKIEVIHLKNSEQKVSHSHSVVSEKSSEVAGDSEKKYETEPEKNSVILDEDDHKEFDAEFDENGNEISSDPENSTDDEGDFEDDSQSKIEQHIHSVTNKSDDDKAYFNGHGSGDGYTGMDFLEGKKDNSTLELPPQHNKEDVIKSM